MKLVLRQDIDKLGKRGEVVKVADISEEDLVARELALVKVTAGPENRSAIIEIVEIFRAKIVDVSPDTLIVEVAGTEDKVDALFEMLKPYGIKELVRTGRVAITRGAGTPTSVDGKKFEHHRYRPAGEGKPKVGSLL